MRATLTSLAGASTLTLLLACGGGGGGSSSTPSGPTHATSLTYTNPTSGSYQLVKDSASSGGTLVLDLVSTTGAPLSGVSFSFNANTTKVTWSPFASAGTSFNLGSGVPAVASKITGNELQGAVSQKGTASPITPAGTTVLAKVTMTLKANISKGSITPFADSGKSTVLTAAGAPAITITTGSLAAQ